MHPRRSTPPSSCRTASWAPAPRTRRSAWAPRTSGSPGSRSPPTAPRRARCSRPGPLRVRGRPTGSSFSWWPVATRAARPAATTDGRGGRVRLAHNALAPDRGLDYLRRVTANTQTARPRTDVDRIAETYFDAAVALSPINATFLGVPGGEEDLDDLSPAGNAAASELRRTTLTRLAAAAAADDVDRVTIDAMTERLRLAEDRYAAGLDEMSLNVLASPLQSVRDVFDLMPQHTTDDWRTFATRMGKIPAALEGYRESLLLARERGQVSPRRQVEACAEQSRELTADDGYFAKVVADATIDDEPLGGEVQEALAASAQAAAAAYGSMADWLEQELLPHAPEADACGRERYALESRYFLGAAVDLEETYSWGQQEVASLHAQM